MKQKKVLSTQLPTRLSLIAMAVISMSAAQAQNAPVVNDSGAQVTITGSKLGMGLMVQEDAPKARSTITAEELAKQRPTGNAYQALELLPAVNSFNYDATGLFGGGLTLRGFNSDQIGATINGVPVNDSGNFAVYPQEYVDQENTCSQFVTQGSTDVDSPQVGATGGNFGIITCQPQKSRRFRVAQTLGSNALSRTFMRYDTGVLGNSKTSLFISGSHSQADKWKGLGGAKRDHIDAGFLTQFDAFNYIHGSFLYNRAINNNIYSLSLAELSKFGYTYDYTTVFPGHVTPSKGVANVDTSPSPQYYNLSQNPFENVVASVTAKFRIAENTDIKILPYFWYGFGTGGSQQRLQAENAFLDKSTGKLTAAVDLNGDGDTLDKVIVANSSVTKTHRPGVTASVTHTIDNHQILGGFWYERAEHLQYGPMVPVDNQGNSTSVFLDSGAINRPDGTPFNSRDQKTVSTAYQLFLQDTINLLNDKLVVNVGVRAPTIKRDFTNYPNEGTNSAIGYNIQRSYSDILPQLGAKYQLSQSSQLFFSLAKNMKAPANFVFTPTGNVSIVNGLPVLGTDVKAETSMSIDTGYRYQGKDYTAQFTAYQSYFKDRQASGFDPILNLATATVNVGQVRSNGFEIELGNTPVNGWSAYGSLGYNNSVIGGDLKLTSTASLGTVNKTFPLDPMWKAGGSLQYETGVWYARFKTKFTGTQQATLMNDEEVPKYMISDLDMGYMFSSTGFFKKPTLRANISNLFNAEYRNPSSQTVTNAVAYPGVSAKNVYYYLGAPRSFSVTLQSDF